MHKFELLLKRFLVINYHFANILKMPKSHLCLLIFLIRFVNALDISIEKTDYGGGTYYRFWFIYAVIAGIMTVLLIFSTVFSMCRRYKLVASQEQELSEIQW